MVLGAGIAATLTTTLACRQDMHDQPKYIPLRESTFFNDNRSARPLVAGTVARGQLRDDVLLYTGKGNVADPTVFPFPVAIDVLARGKSGFELFWSLLSGQT